ncbi:MAG: saccharopine dehydrogenase NADP-binding domain-containing protein [Salinivirgaceae bacterium]|nr:saccharopine dehydrogenase NADP-binding domain-containing protein [Salinivirgaceae bacterium]
MGKKVVVLGGGLVGSTIAMELSKQYEVVVADINDKTLSKLKRGFGVECIQTDITERKKLESIIEDADLVIGAIPGKLGYDVIKRVIEAGKNMVDISFLPEDPLDLDDRAKHKNVTVVIDAGIAPGVSNMIVGYHNSGMKIDRYECMVGGLPFEREWPWEYKAVFSPSDVIEEYVRPARYVENGKQITKEAFSDPELVYFKRIGTLEAWNSDGLRTLLKTMKVPNMVEKTLRYPGTIEYLKVLRESGFFSHQEIDVNGIKIKPIDVTTQLLMPKWELKKGEEDFTILKAKVLGYAGKEPVGYEYVLFDKYDSKTGIHSMSRTTGYTCTAVAGLILDGDFNKTGIITPEELAATDGLFPKIINYLEDRGVDVNVSRLY